MSRNNPDRMGAHAGGDTPAPSAETQTETASPFSFAVPTEFVELPSGGQYYPPNHPLHGQQHIEVRHMTAKEEDILTSRTLLKQGVALERVIQNLIIDKRINPDYLLVGDKNAVIIQARVSGYGSEYATNVTCPACASTAKYNFNLNEAKVYKGDNIASLDILKTENGSFEITLPTSKVNVEFRLLTGADEREILQGSNLDRKRKTGEKNVTRQLRKILVGVNGDRSADTINMLVDNLPSLHARHLRLAYKLAAPNIDLTQHFQCPECEFSQEMEVPLTADFFWPDR